jgi:hypothetical protein
MRDTVAWAKTGAADWSTTRASPSGIACAIPAACQPAPTRAAHYGILEAEGKSAIGAEGRETASRHRGKPRQTNWRKDEDVPVAVVRLSLDASDPRVRRRPERVPNC